MRPGRYPTLSGKTSRCATAFTFTKATSPTSISANASISTTRILTCLLRPTLRRACQRPVVIQVERGDHGKPAPKQGSHLICFTVVVQYTVHKVGDEPEHDAQAVNPHAGF